MSRESSSSSTLLELGGSSLSVSLLLSLPLLPSPLSMSSDQDEPDVITEWLADPNNLTLEDYQNNLVEEEAIEIKPQPPWYSSTPISGRLEQEREDMVVGRALYKRRKVGVIQCMVWYDGAR